MKYLSFTVNLDFNSNIISKKKNSKHGEVRIEPFNQNKIMLLTCF